MSKFELQQDANESSKKIEAHIMNTRKYSKKYNIPIKEKSIEESLDSSKISDGFSMINQIISKYQNLKNSTSLSSNRYEPEVDSSLEINIKRKSKEKFEKFQKIENFENYNLLESIESQDIKNISEKINNPDKGIEERWSKLLMKESLNSSQSSISLSDVSKDSSNIIERIKKRYLDLPGLNELKEENSHNEINTSFNSPTKKPPLVSKSLEFKDKMKNISSSHHTTLQVIEEIKKKNKTREKKRIQSADYLATESFVSIDIPNTISKSLKEQSINQPNNNQLNILPSLIEKDQTNELISIIEQNQNQLKEDYQKEIAQKNNLKNIEEDDSISSNSYSNRKEDYSILNQLINNTVELLIDNNNKEKILTKKYVSPILAPPRKIKHIKYDDFNKSINTESIGYNELQNTLIEAEQLRNVPNVKNVQNVPNVNYTMSKIKMKQISGIQSMINKEEHNTKENSNYENYNENDSKNEILFNSKNKSIKNEEKALKEDNIIKADLLNKRKDSNKQKIDLPQNILMNENNLNNNLMTKKIIEETKKKIPLKEVSKYEKSSYDYLNISNNEIKQLLHLLDINEFDNDFEVNTLKREILSIIVQISNLE